MPNGDFETFHYSPTQAFLVSKPALKQGEVFVKRRIAGWLRIHPDATEIPDYRFFSHLFQVEA
jgi:hypothetical protein